ncbi:MAG: acyl--CoA ligase [Acidobacteriota bacterium]|nr:acyl--CoA ligase [Acidobacteriota bacterium]
MERPLAPTLAGLVRRYAADGEATQRTAIVDDQGTRLTYGELAERAEAFGGALARIGVGKGDTVGLLAPNSAGWVVSLVGAGLSGATVAAFHTWVKERDLEFLLGHSEAKVLVMAATVGERSLLDPLLALVPEIVEGTPGDWSSARFPHLEAVIVLGEGAPGVAGLLPVDEFLRSGGEDAAVGEPETDATAVVLYTSGSTADPKGVPLLQGHLVENGFEIGERMGLTPDDRVWLGSPLFWSFGAANALVATFTHQATLVVQEKFDAAAAVRQVADEVCTAAYLLPAMTYALLAVPGVREAFATVGKGLTIGRSEEVMMVVDGLGVDGVCNIYGSTETYGNCCVTPSDAPLDIRLRSQGPPLAGFEIRIVEEESGQALEAGQPGQVQVRGRVTPGYLKAPELNRATFTEDGWYRTGDVGVLDDHGYFHFVTRDSDMIKTNGINVSPAEIEAFVAGLPGVAEVVVVGAPDPRRDQRIVAFVRAVPGVALDPETVLERCRNELASYKVPHAVQVVETIPLTATGKLSRRLLLDLLPDRAASAERR